MKTKTINLYQFEELTTEQQEKVLNKYRDFNDDMFESYVDDECNTLEITESGFNNPIIHYDLDYSQGDGACFECKDFDDFDFNLLLKDWQHKHKNWIINIIKNYCEFGIRKNQFGYHYSHSKTRDFYIDYCCPLGYDFHKRIIQAIYLAEQHIENLRYELSESLTNRLYEQLEWLQSDEQIAEVLIDNEYYFNEETLEIEY
jgi:hypothetical protein